ncbi:hypothetical protein LBMAG53_21520 [Planctomycetota bacterium]|nr:hypothetical protein LBMAG53_21520 [Planctomycetota bacterium]
MVQINFGQREVSCKVVFYGPGMSGKTTNLEIIHKKAPKDAVGEMVSIATETDRTLYFDFLPLDLGQVAGMRTKFQLYTVPGQIYYNATRKLVLQGVDGVIFVADSNPDKMAENLESLQNLRDNLAEMNLKLDDLPLVLQYNKRDLPNALSVEDMNARMNPMGVPIHEACARDGKGVFATLKEVSRLVIEKLNKDHAPPVNRRRTGGNLTPQRTPVVSPQAAHAPTPGPLQAAAPAPAAPPARPAAAPAPAWTPPKAPAPAPALRPAAPAPADEMSARDKHLAKAKPQPLAAAAKSPATAATEGAMTEPNLKKYKQQTQGGGPFQKFLLLALLIVSLLVVALLLVLFVQPVRALLPLSVQQMLTGPAPQAPIPVQPPAKAEPAPPAGKAPEAAPAEAKPKPEEPKAGQPAEAAKPAPPAEGH